jgi:hypothetical protein
MSKNDLPHMSIDNSTQLLKATHMELIRFINSLRCIECFRYVTGEWSSYDGKVYCQRCWDTRLEKEEALRQNEIKRLKDELRKLGVEIDLPQAPDSTE